jgi:two-component system chemotaxis response regulator CheY
VNPLPPSKPASKRRAIIADDGEVEREFLHRVLTDLGWTVREFGDGASALQEFRKGPVELAALDWNMPGMDGIQVAKAMKASPGGSGTRILMVTGEGDLARIRSALAAGADEYLIKPASRESVVLKLTILGLT